MNKTDLNKEQYIEEIIEIIKDISDTWLLKQIYLCVVNITKN